ncbi:MgtC/SapB family protein [Lacrimispora sp.]|uniref:MgtC/SapB family protein n=1 Tax=Lacrimispora sp. TaxID=2719234 RepID=UPI0028A7E31A|nr:MgtC/SapB family protein [Lacrimispora sp.]
MNYRKKIGHGIMMYIFGEIRDVTILSTCIRMCLAVICGGLIGCERELKRRPAGFRTHILVCLGAAMTTLTGQYIYFYLHYPTDMSRLGAQVIAGIGFIGAGTIITRRERVKGLTTAAGLWTTAIIGLCTGSGFYEGAILSTGIILFAELLLSKLEYKILENVPDINIYMEYKDNECFESVLKYFDTNGIKILNLEITRSKSNNKYNACAIFSIRMKRQHIVREVINDMQKMNGIYNLFEL